MIRLIMFVLLLLCGDIESNPGPNEHQPMDTKQTKFQKIERMDTNEKIGISSSTLERLWIKVHSRWDDVTTDNFELTEVDGTELIDELYYQQLASNIPLQLRSKTKGTKSRSKSNARVNARPLADDVIHEIATNYITLDIVKLGFAMDLKLPIILKYKADNDKEPRTESRGTVNMIMDWRQRCNDPDKVGAFCNVLQQAELNELADNLSNDILTGPDRVEVVSPSVTGFNSYINKGQKGLTIRVSTTSQYTKRVIECNNLPEMPSEDLSRLAESLVKIPDNPLPIAEVDEPTTRITGLPADKLDNIRTADNPKGISVSGSVTKGEQSMASSALSSTDTSSISQTEVGRSTNASLISVDSGFPVDPLGVGLRTEVAPTQPTRSQTSMTSSSSASMGDGNLLYMASATSQLGTRSSYTARISQASLQVDTTFPIALFSLSSSSHPEIVCDELQRQLPGKKIMLIADKQLLASNCHLFEAILLDFEALQEAASYSLAEHMRFLDIYQKCLKRMLVPQNVAVLMLAPANTHIASDTMSMISEFSKTDEIPVFQYGSESCRPSFFDDNTKNRLVFWLLGCYKRYHAAALQKEPSSYKSIYKIVHSFVLKSLGS